MITSSRPSDILIVLTSLPDAVSAQKLATLLIERRLAACVNILAPCQSVYRWQEKIEQATEIPLLIKTTANAYTALEACIRKQHPYELPEIIAVPIDCGLPEYLGWVAAETLSDTSDMPTAAHTSPC